MNNLKKNLNIIKEGYFIEIIKTKKQKNNLNLCKARRFISNSLYVTNSKFEEQQ